MKGGENLFLNLRSHESSTSESTTHEENPHRAPSKSLLQGTNGKESNRSSDCPTPIDETSYSSEGFVVSAHRWMRCKVGSNGRSDDVVGAEGRKNSLVVDK
jgi:hypothetical protein